MWEVWITILIVIGAAGSVIYGLYRSATGKSGCSGCARYPGRETDRAVRGVEQPCDKGNAGTEDQ